VQVESVGYNLQMSVHGGWGCGVDTSAYEAIDVWGSEGMMRYVK